MLLNGALPGRLLAGIPLLILALVFPASAGSQRVEGTLTDREDGSFVEGALVILVDSEGQELTGRLSDERGVFRLSAPEPGLYRLRAVRIGYATLLSDPFPVVEGDTAVVHLVASKEAIPLRGIEVEGVQGCQIRPEEGLAVARVWEAVQKALTLQTWTEREGLFRFEVLLYTRDLDQRAQRTENQDLVKTELLARVPMQSLPAEILVVEGFVRELESDVYEFLAPDAQVLLSNAFLSTHCLRLTVDPDSPSLIGLAFEPAVESDLPDVEGTLWVDRDTGQLKYLEYGYTWVPFDEGRDRAGGRLEFEVLPSGAWIVRQWRIRMPTVQRTGSRTARLLGFKETGAIITKVTRAIH
jgi:hypothetical protein